MISIQIFLLQSPKLLIDGSLLSLPYQKAEGLLYYLAIEKRVTRDQAAALLWDTCDDVTAKKNLRHALYTIKKAAGTELVISVERHMLVLNPGLNIFIDYDEFMEKQQYSVYKGELLKDYYIKNAASFYDWMVAKRGQTAEAYLRQLYQQLRISTPQESEEAEKLFNAYVTQDALDEGIYQIMIELYEKSGLYYKGIKLYQKLEKLLKTELDAVPGKEMRLLYKRLLYALGETSDEIPLGLLGREAELASLAEYFDRFLGGGTEALLLTGISGSGKTYLAEYLLRLMGGKPCLILKASCLETEQSILLQPWNQMMQELEHRLQPQKLSLGNEYAEAASSLISMFGSLDIPQLHEEDLSASYRYRCTRDLIMKLFSSLSRQVPLLLFFDNVNFMDSASIDLLSRLIRSQSPNFMFFGTCPHTLSDKQEAVLSSLISDGKLTEHIITPSKVISTEKIGSSPADSVSGSTFRELSLNKLAKLSHNAKQLLSLLSACQTNAYLQLFEDLLELDPMTILDILEDLKEQDILYEKVVGKNIYFAFRNNSIRKLVYEEMSLSKRRYFHERLAEHLIGLGGIETMDYECLIYHYSQSGNEALELKYHIVLLEEYTKRYYELYPMQYSYSRDIRNDIQSFSEYCDRLEVKLLSLNSVELEKINAPRLYISLLHTKAQYCVAQGEYEGGLNSVSKAIKINHETGNDPLIHIRCLRLVNFYRLNIWETRNLRASLSECLHLGEANHFDEDFAIDCRLYGLYSAMCGDYKSSLHFLRKSLRIFSNFTMKSRVYTRNIAACYNYMGESYRKQEQFEKAIGFYQKAIQLCGGISCSSNAVFYSNLGRAYLALDKKEESAEAFYRSEQIYNDSAALIGRSITKGYVSILEAEKGSYAASVRLLAEAADSARQLASPHALGLLALTRYTLSSRFPDEFQTVLTKSASNYQKEALQYLKNIPGMYEISRLNTD